MRILSFARRRGFGWPIRFWFKNADEFWTFLGWAMVVFGFVSMAIAITHTPS